MINDIGLLYERPMPSTRGGPFFSAFSYPTKISPEAIALYIATHTEPGDTVLDVFAGTGTTGLAALLCGRPTPEMIGHAEAMGVAPQWGARNAVLVELGVLGSFVARTLCNPPDPGAFLDQVEKLIGETEKHLTGLYATLGPDGEIGTIRHVIWSDILQCHVCGLEVPFWDSAVRLRPARILNVFSCPSCKTQRPLSEVERVYETFWDPLLQTQAERRKRVPARIHGETAGRKWQRSGTADDLLTLRSGEFPAAACTPVVPIPWGDLYRSGYHRGLTHAHHFYTYRNLVVFSHLWQRVESAPSNMRNALRFLLLSYNATHATIMTRVVAKSNQDDLALTGAQSGVLYISSLPVEKNLFLGLRRKASTIAKAFSAVPQGQGRVRVIHGSSTKLALPSGSVDYIFTDPPFGDFIPYAELNFLNEIWLGTHTDVGEEAIVSSAQGKGVAEYGRLMKTVLREAHRVLKTDGCATVVFHSARAEIWSVLQEAYSQAGFAVHSAGVLDKVQGSFKQVTASASVKGDPLLLLKKSGNPIKEVWQSIPSDIALEEVLAMAKASGDARELSVDRMYSRYVAQCLSRGLPVKQDAPQFYARARQLLRKS